MATIRHFYVEVENWNVRHFQLDALIDRIKKEVGGVYEASRIEGKLLEEIEGELENK